MTNHDTIIVEGGTLTLRAEGDVFGLEMAAGFNEPQAVILHRAEAEWLRASIDRFLNTSTFEREAEL